MKVNIQNDKNKLSVFVLVNLIYHINILFPVIMCPPVIHLLD